MPVGRLDRYKAKERLRQCLDSGRVIPSKHFRDELANENLKLLDAWSVLGDGAIFNEPEFHAGAQEWNYRIEGHEPGGKWLAIVFSFKAVDAAFLVTVFSIQARSR
jgi:hypothetical protein